MSITKNASYVKGWGDIWSNWVLKSLQGLTVWEHRLIDFLCQAALSLLKSPATERGGDLVVMRLTPRFLDSSFKALHQAPLHWLFQLFSDSAHSSRAAASSFAALSSAVLCWFPTPLCWKYCMKYSIRVTRDAMNSVTMHSHCGSSKPKYELSKSDILCEWKRWSQLNTPPLRNFLATS